MRYYVLADVHGFYTEMHNALEEKGYFSDTTPHKLIICGDIFDRGREAIKLQEFLCSIPEDELILIRGNHEDLFESMLNNWHRKSYNEGHHYMNGTVGTALQLANVSEESLDVHPIDAYINLRNCPFVKKILPNMINYYETKNYIFVHGWIPFLSVEDEFTGLKTESYLNGWREQDDKAWDLARWANGMDLASKGIIEPNKTIVCGHWHCSYGHYKFEGAKKELGVGADYSPYSAKGILAIDACTARSGVVNCVVIEDEEK